MIFQDEETETRCDDAIAIFKELFHSQRVVRLFKYIVYKSPRSIHMYKCNKAATSRIKFVSQHVQASWGNPMHNISRFQRQDSLSQLKAD